MFHSYPTVKSSLRGKNQQLLKYWLGREQGLKANFFLTYIFSQNVGRSSIFCNGSSYQKCSGTICTSLQWKKLWSQSVPICLTTCQWRWQRRRWQQSFMHYLITNDSDISITCFCSMCKTEVKLAFGGKTNWVRQHIRKNKMYIQLSNGICTLSSFVQKVSSSYCSKEWLIHSGYVPILQVHPICS